MLMTLISFSVTRRFRYGLLLQNDRLQVAYKMSTSPQTPFNLPTEGDP